MAYCNGQGVRRMVGTRRLGQGQQGLHHELNLRFGGGSAANHRSLNLGRGVLADRATALRGGQERHAASLPYQHRAASAPAVETTLDGDVGRAEPLHNLHDPPVKLGQPLGDRPFGGYSEAPVCDRARVRSCRFDHSVAGGGESWVDAENNRRTLPGRIPRVRGVGRRGLPKAPARFGSSAAIRGQRSPSRFTKSTDGGHSFYKSCSSSSGMSKLA